MHDEKTKGSTIDEESKFKTRRNFLRDFAAPAAAIAGGAVVLSAVGACRPKSVLKKDKAGITPRWAMLVDLKRCIGCRTCTVACKSENEVPLGVFRTFVHELEEGNFPNTKRFFAATQCNHCSEAPCLPVCPVDPIKGTYKSPNGDNIEYERRATYQRPDGVVLVDYDRCIGCHACVEACPYQARYVDPSKKAGGDPANNTVGKCTYCDHRIDNGVAPSCVQTCLGKALLLGDLNDPSSEISKRLKSEKTQVWMPGEGTKPKTYYASLENQAVLGKEVK
jgi:tetrathionate reductase subunit B